VTAFHEEMAVHGRYRKPCPVCGSPVQRIVYAENETNYCARCQTGGKILADRALSRLLKASWPRSIDELEELRRAPAGRPPRARRTSIPRSRAAGPGARRTRRTDPAQIRTRLGNRKVPRDRASDGACAPPPGGTPGRSRCGVRSLRKSAAAGPGRAPTTLPS